MQGDDFLVMATDGLWDVMTNVQVTATEMEAEELRQAGECDKEIVWWECGKERRK